MALELSKNVLPDHIRFTFLGDYTFTDMMKQVEIIKMQAEEAERDHIFIDARSINGRPTESEKFFLGTHLAEVFGARIKAVSLMPEGCVTKLGEMAAANRGARFLVTESKTEAMEWQLPSTAMARS